MGPFSHSIRRQKSIQIWRAHLAVLKLVRRANLRGLSNAKLSSLHCIALHHYSLQKIVRDSFLQFFSYSGGKLIQKIALSVLKVLPLKVFKCTSLKGGESFPHYNF
jgi:hypothetical protein